MTELNGKIAAVTGAASGIGLASTEAMLAAGATVVLGTAIRGRLRRFANGLASAPFRW